VLQAVLKLLLVKLLTRLPFLFAKRALGNILAFWDELLLLEVVIMAPTLTLVLGVYLANSEMFGCRSLVETVSNALLISVSFASFLFMIFKHYVRAKRYRNKLQLMKNLTSKQFNFYRHQNKYK
jgi:hypothetical protein